MPYMLIIAARSVCPAFVVGIEHKTSSSVHWLVTPSIFESTIYLHVVFINCTSAWFCSVVSGNSASWLVFPWLTVCVAGHACTKQAGDIYRQHHFGVVAIIKSWMINVACTNSTGTSNNTIGTMLILSPGLSSREATKSIPMQHAYCSFSNLYSILMHFRNQFTCCKALGTTAGLGFLSDMHIQALLQ